MDSNQVYSILRLLLSNQVISKDANLKEYSLLNENDFIRTELDKILNCLDAMLVPATDSFYFMAKPGSGPLSYTNAELRDKFRLNNNTQLYTLYFCILCMLALFYQSDGHTRVRDSIETKNVLEYANKKINWLLTQDLDELDETYEYNFGAVVEYWGNMMDYSEVKTLLSKEVKVGFIHHAAKALEAEGFIVIEGLNEEEATNEIYNLTSKLDALISHGYGDISRLSSILSLLNGEHAFEEELHGQT